MASEIEDIIENIENYIDNCKSSMFSNNKITVDREEMESLLEELRTRTPVEIKQYQRLLKNQKAIIDDAHKQADHIIEEAKARSNQMMSENQIMQQAYEKATEVVNIAQKNADEAVNTAQQKADEIVTKATEQANTIQLSAIGYTDSLLKSVQDVLNGSITTTSTRLKNYLGTMQGYLDTVNANRAELAKVLNNPDNVTDAAQTQPREDQSQQQADDTANKPEENK